MSSQHKIQFLALFILLSVIGIKGIVEETADSVKDETKKATLEMEAYYKDREAEIEKILKGSPGNSKWSFIRTVRNIQLYHSTDIRDREIEALAVLSQNWPDKGEKAKGFHIKGLKAAQKFWEGQVNNALEHLRKNPNAFRGLISDPIFTTESNPPKLPTNDLKVFQAQYSNLTNLADITKHIITSRLLDKKLRLAPPGTADINVNSVETNIVRKLNAIKEYQHKLIDSNRISRSETIIHSWKDKPVTDAEFASLYSSLDSSLASTLEDFKSDLPRRLNDHQ